MRSFTIRNAGTRDLELMQHMLRDFSNGACAGVDEDVGLAIERSALFEKRTNLPERVRSL